MESFYRDEVWEKCPWMIREWSDGWLGRKRSMTPVRDFPRWCSVVEFWLKRKGICDLDGFLCPRKMSYSMIKQLQSNTTIPAHFSRGDNIRKAAAQTTIYSPWILFNSTCSHASLYFPSCWCSTDGLFSTLCEPILEPLDRQKHWNSEPPRLVGISSCIR